MIQAVRDYEGDDPAALESQALFENKVAVAEYWAVNGAGTVEGASEVVDAVSADSDTSSDEAIQSIIDDALAEAPDTDLTVGRDDLSGSDSDDVFEAPAVQNDDGAVTNTLESGDRIDGDEGQDTLNADVTLTTSGGVPVGPAISPITDDVEVVNFRVQSATVDTGGSTGGAGLIGLLGNGSSVDAERMSGVEQWWSDNSRSNLQIEDIRSNPADTAFGMRSTDPGGAGLNAGASFGAYFNANYLTGEVTETESAFTLTIQEITDGQNPADTELENISVREVNFTLEGEDFTLESDDIQAADTWADLETAISDELASQGLDSLSVEHRGNGQFVIEDANSGTFEVTAEEALIFGAASDIDVRNRVQLGEAQEVEGQTRTNVFLDDAGNGSQGGMLDIGAMSGDRGVEVFDVEVVSDSHLQGMMSTNFRNGDNYLEEVYVDGEGDLTLGNTDADTIDGRAVGGLTDVRVLDASALDGSLNAGINLTGNSIDRYLDDAEDVVNFDYTGTANDDILSVAVNNALAGDPDFAMNVNTGDGDDRVNLIGGQFALAGVTLEGEDGFDTLETSSDIGVDDDSTPAVFDSFEKLVLAGNNDVDADMDALPGVEEVWVATSGNSDSTISNLEADTTLTISGKNQTLGAGNGDSNQLFDDIVLVDPQAETQTVTLDNTARNSGVLNVDSLVIDGGNTDTVEVISGGRRDTSNVVEDIQAEDASRVEFGGTQDLSAHVSSLAENAGQELGIDGSALEGDLTLAVDAGLLDQGSDDEIVGTEGEEDRLALYGATGGINTRIDGVETIQFGWNTGSDLANLFTSGASANAGDGTNNPFSFNAANATGTEEYIIALRGAGNGVTLDNLSSGVDVQLGVDDATTTSMATAPNTLNAASDGVLNLRLADNIVGLNETEVNGFDTVNFEVTSSQLGGFRGHDLALDDAARTLDITGGGEDGDGLFLTPLNTSLTSIDVTGYEGDFISGWSGQTGSNATVRVDSDSFFFDLLGDFGQTAAFKAEQLGDDADYDVNDEITVTVDGLIDGFTAPTGTLTYTLAGGEDNRADALTALADEIDGLPATTVTLGGNDYDVAYDASFEDGILSVDFDVVDEDGNPVDSEVTGFSYEMDDSGGGGTTIGPIDESEAVSTFITTFRFTEDAGEDAGGTTNTWTIDEFNGLGEDGVSLSNVTVLDMRDLGVEGLADINITDDGSDTTITSNEGMDFEITLLGVTEADLNNENFAFAS
ncbi:hypothetical protein [Arhodomonas sp. SL1]|uniref:hypothetical protein n=1 Tax=Arhodomonas sp. SL1 TaxID=3425691 RepID=UPI003F8842A1